MADRILLVLGISAEEYGGIFIEKTAEGRNVKIKGKAQVAEESLMKEALLYARDYSKKVVALQILSSDLYHYGYNDIILTAPPKTQFLSYVRSKVIERGERCAERFRKLAKEHGVAVEIKTIEVDDPTSAVLEEARKGYDMIFLHREKKHLFPLLKKTTEQVLRKQGYRYIATC
ncbi:MAG: hypothetical protein JRJ03_05270 [Deltaproteobacteria bacterium]|nr:hypothetical protein [Deltaproteobacteria bacterium]